MSKQSVPVVASIETLNRLLRGEQSVIATYEKAQRHLPEHAADVEANRACHASRVEMLIHRITALGGRPSTSGLAEPSSCSDDFLIPNMVVSELVQAESSILRCYSLLPEALDPTSLALVREDLLPAQERTHRQMTGIKASR